MYSGPKNVATKNVAFSLRDVRISVKKKRRPQSRKENQSVTKNEVRSPAVLQNIEK